MKKFSLSTWLYFLIPSILGVILFMIPLKFGDEWKVPIAKLADILSTAIEPAMPMAAMIRNYHCGTRFRSFFIRQTESFETVISSQIYSKYHRFGQSLASSGLFSQSW